MGIETSFKEFQSQVNIITGRNRDADQVLGFDDAAERVRQKIMPDIQRVMNEEVEDKSKPKKKSDLKHQKDTFESMIRQAVYSDSYAVSGYEDMDDFVLDMVEEIVGHSILAKAFADPDVDDIFCLSWDNIYVERNGENEVYADPDILVQAVDEHGQPLVEIDEQGQPILDKTGEPVPLLVPQPITFRNPKHFHDFIGRVLGLTGKQVDQGNHKIVDAEFYEDRIAVTGKSVSPIDMSMTIRKHRENHLTLENIVESGVMDEEIADLLGTIILGESNVIYAGITGSGKTTTIRALLDFYVSRSNKRMLVAEDTQELFPQNPHTLELVTSPTNDPRTNVNLRDLIMTALRLKPKYIVVGEVRGAEAEAAVEAMETGHSTIFTMHGGTAWNIVNRLVNKYLMQMPSLSIDVVERIIGNAVDYIAIQDAIPGIGRRVTSITEVTYDFESGRVVLVPIIEFDFETEGFLQINKLSPEKANSMMRRGISRNELADLTREREDVFYKNITQFKEALSQQARPTKDKRSIVLDTEEDFSEEF